MQNFFGGTEGSHRSLCQDSQCFNQDLNQASLHANLFHVCMLNVAFQSFSALSGLPIAYHWHTVHCSFMAVWTHPNLCNFRLCKFRLSKIKIIMIMNIKILTCLKHATFFVMELKEQWVEVAEKSCWAEVLT